MKKIISIVLAIALVMALMIPMTVNAEDGGVKLTITEDYDINWFHHPGISSHELVEKDGKWAFKYTSNAAEGDPYYALPYNYDAANPAGFLSEFNGDYHYAVMDIYYDAPEGNDTYVSFRLNHTQSEGVWTQRHITNGIETGKWTKVVIDMTGAADALGTSEVWSAGGTGVAYNDGEKFGDSRIYFTFNGNVNAYAGNVVYFHELAMFKTKAEAEAYANPVPEVTYNFVDMAVSDDKTGNPGDSCCLGADGVYGVRVNSKANFCGLKIPHWIPGGGQGYGKFNISIYNWNKDYETTVAGSKVFSNDYETTHDDMSYAIDFGQDIAAGEYLIVMTVLELNADAGNGIHMVSGIKINDTDYIEKFVSGTAIGTAAGDNERYCFWALKTTAADVYDVLGAAPETTAPETTAPETTAPQTGDMTVAAFAVIAVIALASVVIFKKKVNA